MFGLSPVELMVVGVVAVLLFGSKLPSVARSLGKSMGEFKKGMEDLKNEMHQAENRPAQVRRYHDIDDRDEATAPKFEPPAAEPTLDESRSGSTLNGRELRNIQMGEEPRSDATPETVPPDANDKPFGASS